MTKLSWSERLMAARAAGRVLRPPSPWRGLTAWHILETGAGQVRAEWQPGVERWISEQGENWPAEELGEDGWTYVGLSPDRAPS